MWRATILTLFPELFPGPLGASILGRGLADGAWSLDTVNIRDFSDNAYGSVDDTPAGGGAGLVMRADILANALDSIPVTLSDDSSSTPEDAADDIAVRGDRPIVYLSPRGAPLTQARAQSLSQGPGLIALCGRFEGVDQRILDAREIEEISIGDFVLAGGEIPAMALIEACVRLIPGVLGSAQSLGQESFSLTAHDLGLDRANAELETATLLEYPQYTRPRVFEGREIPDVLLSGDHKKVAEWRAAQALNTTRTRRPDLLKKVTTNGPLRRGDN